MPINLTNIIEQVGKDKGIDKEILIEALESAMLKAAEKRFGPSKEIEAHYNEEFNEIELFVFKDVVEDVEEPDLEINIDDAKDLDPEAELGDTLGVKLDSKEFGRIDAQTAKQIIIQKVREAERGIVFEDYKDKEGEIITGIVQRFDKGDIIVDLGRTEALLPKREQVRREGYRQGDRIRGLVIEVNNESRGPQVILSRVDPRFLIDLFQMEVPEIYENIVEIKGAAREPGDRAKIAVASNSSDVDPVGACVGVKGSRVQAVVQELKGEKIDIVHWSDDPALFVKNTLSPAQISRVIVDEDEQAMEVIVPDDQLSLAIGKKGQNVRLAAKLTGWKIDIKTESDFKDGDEELSPEEALRKAFEAAEAEQAELESREAVEAAAGEGAEATPAEGLAGIAPEVIAILKEAGFDTPESLVNISREELLAFEGIDEETAEKLLSIVSEAAAGEAEEAAAEETEDAAEDAEEAAGEAEEAAGEAEEEESGEEPAEEEPDEEKEA